MSDKDRGRSTRRKAKRKSPSSKVPDGIAKETPAPAPCKNEGLKNLFITMLRDKFAAAITNKPYLNNPQTMDLVVKPIIKYVTGEPPAIITCLLQYSKDSLFHSIYRFITGQVEQLHFQYVDVMNLINDIQLYRMMNEETIAFRTDCMREFIEHIMPPDQLLASNTEIIILRQDNIQLVILYATHGATNNIAVKIHGEGKYMTCEYLLISLSIMQFVCCRYLCNTPCLIDACIEQHKRSPFLPASGRKRLLDSADGHNAAKYLSSIRTKTMKTYWACFMSGIRKENNFGVVPLDTL